MLGDSKYKSNHSKEIKLFLYAYYQKYLKEYYDNGQIDDRGNKVSVI